MDRPFAVMQHLDECRKEIIHAVAQLLHIGVLVGGALVPVNGDALVHDLAVHVLFLAQGFHDELLQIFREQHQPVAVRQDHHVPLSPAPGRMEPGQRQQRRRV